MNKGTPQELYKYMSAERCYQVLESGMIRFSSPLLFNDPFDIIRNLEFLFDEKYQDEFLIFFHDTYCRTNRLDELAPHFIRFGNVILDFISLFNFSDPNEIDFREIIDNPTRFIDKIFLKKVNINDVLLKIKKTVKTLFEEYKKAWDLKVRKLRILCLSSEIYNIPLWYHYADKYKGATISFKVNNKILLENNEDIINRIANGSSVKSVKYKNKIDIISNKKYIWFELFCTKIDSTINERLMSELLIEKFIDWEYEKEKRVVFIQEDSYDGRLYIDLKLNPIAIDKIYLGPEMDPQNKSKIIALAKYRYPQVDIYQAKIKYSLEFEKI